jgi:hypothetical protein
MMAAKHLCPTCGYKIPRQPKKARTNNEAPAKPANSFWSKLIKWDFAASTVKQPEPTQEKPAIIS